GTAALHRGARRRDRPPRGPHRWAPRRAGTRVRRATLPEGDHHRQGRLPAPERRGSGPQTDPGTPWGARLPGSARQGREGLAEGPEVPAAFRVLTWASAPPTGAASSAPGHSSSPPSPSPY